VQPGDAVIVNGYLGDHGAAIMAARGDMALVTTVESDCQPLSDLMEAIVDAVPTTRCARDATRGGAASVLNEIAEISGTHIVIDETTFPIRKEVKGLCEILGIDPLYLANEGTLVVFVPEAEAQKAIAAMQSVPAGRDAKIIGQVKSGTPGRVEMTTAFGGARIVDMLVGDQLPRIC
jgi:hydrogenase expression/formation protein HypE